MNLTAVPSLPPGQIVAEIAEIRKAARDILASRKKRIAFLREVGVMAGKNRNGASRTRNHQQAIRK